MRIETERFMNFIRKQTKAGSLILQHHSEGLETTVKEDEEILKMWMRFQLHEDTQDI